MADDDDSIADIAGSSGLLVWQKYNIMSRHYERLTIANKRSIFGIMRKHCNVSGLENHYLPTFGITLGEFSMFHTISEHIMKIRKQKKNSAKNNNRNGGDGDTVCHK